MKIPFALALTAIAGLSVATSCILTGGDENTEKTEATAEKAETVTPDVAAYCAALDAFSLKTDSIERLEDFQSLDRRPVDKLGRVPVDINDADRQLLAKTLLDCINRIETNYYRLSIGNGNNVAELVSEFNTRFATLQNGGIDSMLVKARTLPEAIDMVNGVLGK